MIKDGQVLIVDEFTGRVLPGRRWSDGLHQAVEAKENVKIERENQTLATITFQNYFRLYEKLAGMTGTADTEASEFHQIYKLDVVVIPTNQPMIRERQPGRRLPHSEREKYDAVVDEILQLREKGQPVLVGTVSIEKSERLSDLLQAARKVPARRAERQVPREGGRDRRAGRTSGRRHDRDQHGRPRNRHRPRRKPGGGRHARARRTSRTATSTSAAWPRLRETCARRQGEGPRRPAASTSSAPSATSRGASTTSCAAASGRQGDPGSSRFYLSLEDDLMRIFGSDRLSEHHAAPRHGGRRSDRARHGLPRRSSARRSRSRPATSRSASTCSSTTT